MSERKMTRERLRQECALRLIVAELTASNSVLDDREAIAWAWSMAGKFVAQEAEEPS